MSRMRRRRRHRKKSAANVDGTTWLFMGSNAPFRAGVVMLWTIVLLVALALTLDWLLRPDRFPVESVNFEGRFEHVTKEQLVEVTKEQVHGNLFAVDLDAVKAQVESLPWVYTASVRRRWPHHLHIRFTEQQLIARWGDTAWVNHAGELVRLGAVALSTPLPQLRGPDGTHADVLAHYRRFERALASVGLHAKAVTLTPRRSWKVELDKGVTLVLERADPDVKIARFVRVYPHALVRYANRIKQVDLRYTNGFSVEWIEPPDALAWLD